MRGEDTERRKAEEIEGRGSSRVIGLRRAANAASSSLYSFYKHTLLSVNATHPVSSHILLLSHSFSSP